MYNFNFDIWKFGHPQCDNSANGALSKMTFTGNGDYGDGGDPVTVETGMTEADFSNKKLGPAGAIILAAWIEHK